MSGKPKTDADLGPPGKIIANEWAAYRERVMDASVEVLQVQENRRAFYAGAMAMFRATTAATDPTTDEPTEEDMRVFDSVLAELLAFNEDVKAGRA